MFGGLHKLSLPWLIASIVGLLKRLWPLILTPQPLKIEKNASSLNCNLWLSRALLTALRNRSKLKLGACSRWYSNVFPIDHTQQHLVYLSSLQLRPSYGSTIMRSQHENLERWSAPDPRIMFAKAIACTRTLSILSHTTHCQSPRSMSSYFQC